MARVAETRAAGVETQAAAARLFHRLNNQLGVVLANAELLESRLTDDAQRARAGQVVSGTIEAIGVVQQLRRIGEPESDR